MEDLKELRGLMLSESKSKLSSLGSLNAGSEEYKNGVESTTKLVAAIAELDDREKSDVLNQKKMHEEKIDRVVDRVTKIVGVTAAIAVPVTMGFVSMNFEKYGSFTTEAGRNAIRKCLNFFVK